ncbi:cytochrome-c peroxidase [Pseudofulvibacter geojedonensis]|uniref:Cytochrome-c peroxidase n=1 Tax=Pseudofulvibacter geojedonensis TaxID=1123758 RepID=A0ABW3HYV2_9FLAO
MNLICNAKKGALLLSFFFLFVACKQEKNNTNYQSIKYISSLETFYKNNLENCLHYCKLIDSSVSKKENIKNYKNAKLAFKKTEAIMSFFNASLYKSLNRPNLPIVDEDDNAEKIIYPTGFQVVEELLSEDDLDITAIIQNRDNISNILKLELNNCSFKKIKDYHIIWAIQDNYLRIVSLGISGFDSPVLLQSLPETIASLEGVKELLTSYELKFSNSEIYKNQLSELNKAIASLQNQDFNKFDRYNFIKHHINPLLTLLKETSLDWKVSFPFDRKFANNTTNLFSKEAFNLHQFSPRYQKVTNNVVELGKELFNDSQLSSNNSLSCFSCHQPDKAFTDGQQFSTANNGAFVKRNSPTLLYSGLQAAQFYDARAASLENQILGVIKDKKEFHNNIDSLVLNLQNSLNYREKFKKVFNQEINSQNFRHAIATYVRTLSNFDSKFDKNMAGKENNLSQEEINGFNLFMGKAKCATCHFAPVFNGTVPPLYNESELEVLGIPNEAIWEKAIVDDDLGRYDLFKAKKKKHAFKTPTVRNSNQTAPYMHNGIYNTLEDVIKFYNVGGGVGIGIELENQTLPTDSLNLTERETKNIIAFLKSLDDEPYSNN